MTLTTVAAMRAPRARTRLQIRRVVGAAVVLFVFFLPLHFHASFGAEVGDECSCVHGTRTQLTPAAPVTTAAPPLVSILVERSESIWTGDWSTQQHVRGPPALRFA